MYPSSLIEECLKQALSEATFSATLFLGVALAITPVAMTHLGKITTKEEEEKGEAVVKGIAYAFFISALLWLYILL